MPSLLAGRDLPARRRQGIDPKPISLNGPCPPGLLVEQSPSAMGWNSPKTTFTGFAPVRTSCKIERCMWRCAAAGDGEWACDRADGGRAGNAGHAHERGRGLGHCGSLPQDRCAAASLSLPGSPLASLLTEKISILRMGGQKCQ